MSSELGRFLQEYGRKAHAGWDPNDRSYDREVEKKIKAMPASELGKLMDGEDESLTIEEENAWFSQEVIDGLRFKLNDPVVYEANGTVNIGSVVALLAARPVPKYLVELSDGTDVQVYEKDIKPANI